MNTLRALASDISEGLKQVKHSGSNEKRAALKAFTSLAFGENIKKTRARKSLGKIVEFNAKSISKAIRTRESTLKGDTESWLYTKRKVRQDAISEEAIFNYWTNTASTTTGDKKDFVKKRIRKQQYVHHAKHVLEKTQTEAFLEFQQLYPNVKVKQRKFESLKPFFVKQAKERDRRSCLCRKHVETKIVFNPCMKFRQGIAKEADNNEYAVLKNVTEAAEKTLCPKQEDKLFHNIKCLERQCDLCGVNALPLLPEEMATEGSVRWSRYEYVPTGKFLSNGQEKKKIALVQKETPPSELFKYFKELLATYPVHSFMARWQRDQLDNLLENLPFGHVVCVHDYSEGFACRQQDEIQSEYFDVAKVSLHVIILHCHAIQAIDGVESTEEEPHPIKEHVFVISDDPIQDQDSIHKVQELIETTWPKILVTMSLRCTSLPMVVRPSTNPVIVLVTSPALLLTLPSKSSAIFFETSHAKGEQDAAALHVKQKVSQAVLRRTATMNSAKSMDQ